MGSLGASVAGSGSGSVEGALLVVVVVLGHAVLVSAGLALPSVKLSTSITVSPMEPARAIQSRSQVRSSTATPDLSDANTVNIKILSFDVNLPTGFAVDLAAAADTEAGGAAEDDEASLSFISDNSAIALSRSSSNLRHVSCTCCLDFLLNFRHSLAGMLGGLREPCNGLAKMRLPWWSYRYHRPITS